MAVTWHLSAPAVVFFHSDQFVFLQVFVCPVFSWLFVFGFALSALTLLVGRQEGRLWSVKKTRVLVCGGDLTALKSWLAPLPPPSYLAALKSRIC